MGTRDDDDDEQAPKSVLPGGRAIVSRAPLPSLSDDAEHTATFAWEIPIAKQKTARAVEARAIGKTYGEGGQVTEILKDVTFYALRGEFIMLVGPSGSGKTTFLSILGCVLRASRGSLQLFGHEITQLSEDQLPAVRRKMIGFVFQGNNLINAMSAEENVLLQLYMRGIEGAPAKTEARALLERVGLTSNQTSRKPEELSGGQRQRVAIARAVAGNPPLILADEPTASLDQKTGLAVTQMLKELAMERKHTVITVTHDPRIFTFADRMVYLEDGRIKRAEDASMSALYNVGAIREKP